MIDNKDKVFLSRIQLIQNPSGCERLKTITNNIEWDPVSQGCYIKKNTTAHALAVILGFDPWQNKPIPDGTYDRNGIVK